MKKRRYILGNLAFYWAIFTLLMMVVMPSAVASDDKRNFSIAYKDYLANIEAKASSQTLAEQAESLVSQARIVFGENHDNTINLTISAANHYRDAELKEEALSLYDKALGLYRENDKDRGIEMGSLIVEILSSPKLFLRYEDKTRLGNDLYAILKRYFDKDSTDPKHILESLLMFNSLLEDAGSIRQARQLRTLGQELISASNEILPKTSVELVRANYNFARLAESTSREDEAIEYYTKVIDINDTELDYDHPFALGAHARLVNIFETQGKSEQATKHCLAIGKMTPWLEELEPIPLYRVSPKYPTSYARRRKDGFAIITFELSPYGFVENMSVLDSNGEPFEIESKKALSKWRYAPKFKEGKPVRASGLKVKLEFSIGRPERKLSNS